MQVVWYHVIVMTTIVITSIIQGMPRGQLGSGERFQELFEEFNDLQNRGRVALDILRYIRHIESVPILDSYISGDLSVVLNVNTRIEVDVIRRSLEGERSDQNPVKVASCSTSMPSIEPVVSTGMGR